MSDRVRELFIRAAEKAGFRVFLVSKGQFIKIMGIMEKKPRKPTNERNALDDHKDVLKAHKKRAVR